MTYPEPISSPTLFGEPSAFESGADDRQHVPPFFPDAALPGDERPPKNCEPSGAPDFRAALSGQPLEFAKPPEAPIMAFGDPSRIPPEQLQWVHFAGRRAWLVRIGALGKLNAVEHVLLGVVRDELVDLGAAAIDYGIADWVAMQRLELTLGKSIEAVFDDGMAVQPTVRVHPGPTCLVWFAPMPPCETYSCGPRFITREILDARDAQRAEFHKRRDAALALKRKWSIESMRNRGDALPPWLPGFAVDAIKNSSHWLKIPPPVPAPAITATISARLSYGVVESAPCLKKGEVSDGPRRLGWGVIDS